MVNIFQLTVGSGVGLGITVTVDEVGVTVVGTTICWPKKMPPAPTATIMMATNNTQGSLEETGGGVGAGTTGWTGGIAGTVDTCFSNIKGLQAFNILSDIRQVGVHDLGQRTSNNHDNYEYYVGRIRRFYTTNEVDHAMNPTTQGKALGPPPLLSCTVEIETALTTMNFNNDVMQKGTLLGKIISLEVPDGDSITNSVNSDWVRQVQNHLQYLHSGTKSGQGMAAIAGVKDVFDITKPGEVELNFRESRPELDKRISTRLGIPSEKIGIPRSTTAQYQPSLVENVVNAQFDATINSYTVDAANFFNRFLLQDKLGIHDAKLVPAGRYGAITLAAAQTIKELAAGGPIITVNEAREKILGWEPLQPGDPRGNMVLNNSTGVPLEQGPTMTAPETLDPELEYDKSFDKISQGKTLFIKIGGLDDGTISTSRPRIYREVFQAEDQKGK